MGKHDPGNILAIRFQGVFGLLPRKLQLFLLNEFVYFRLNVMVVISLKNFLNY